MNSTFAKEDYSDDEWGFGQILAVFVWLPTLVEAVVWISRVTVYKNCKPHTHLS